MNNSLKTSNVQSQERRSLPKGLELVMPYLNILKNVPANAWDTFNNTYVSTNHLYEPTLKAGILHAHMKDEFQKASITTEGLNYLEAYSKQHMLIVNGKALIRFKKMDKQYNTSNIPTKIQEMLRHANLELFEMEKLNHLIEVGYVPNPTWDYFDSIVIKEVGFGEPRWIVLYDKNLNFISSTTGSFDLFEENYQEPSTEEELVLKLKGK